LLCRFDSDVAVVELVETVGLVQMLTSRYNARLSCRRFVTCYITCYVHGAVASRRYLLPPHRRARFLRSPVLLLLLVMGTFHKFCCSICCHRFCQYACFPTFHTNDTLLLLLLLLVLLSIFVLAVTFPEFSRLPQSPKTEGFGIITA